MHRSAANNQLTQWGATTLTYDLDGNLTSDGTTAYTWNARNQLGAFGAISFAYDSVGRRTRNASGTAFLYDSVNAVQELSGSTVTANLLTGPGVDEAFTRTDSTGTRNFLTDSLGSALALTDSAGTMQTQYTYEPFGKTTASGTANTSTFQYTGRENDGTGLYYYRARYYNPTLGRFISEDPLGFGGGDANLYAYTGNRPTGSTDPAGTSTSGVHFDETRNAAESVGYTPFAARAIAWFVVWQDFWPPWTQGTDPSETSGHGMGGLTGRASHKRSQGCREAYDDAVNRLRGDIANGDWSDALHEIQDTYSPSHQYSTWTGGWPSQSHHSADTLYQPGAEAASAAFLKSVLNGSPFADPQSYLAPPPANCN